MIKHKITHYDNFNIKSLEEYHNDKLVSKTIWNPKGEKIYYKDNKIEANYENNKLNGKCLYFHDNGVLSNEGNYINGKPYGELINYHDNGNIVQKANYDEKGQLQGKLFAYDYNGKLYAESFYINNKLIFSKSK